MTAPLGPSAGDRVRTGCVTVDLSRLAIRTETSSCVATFWQEGDVFLMNTFANCSSILCCFYGSMGCRRCFSMRFFCPLTAVVDGKVGQSLIDLLLCLVVFFGTGSSVRQPLVMFFKCSRESGVWAACGRCDSAVSRVKCRQRCCCGGICMIYFVMRLCLCLRLPQV